MIVYVVTNPELGWDCVVKVFLADNENEVNKHLKKEFGEDWEDVYAVHEKLTNDLR